MEDIHPPSDIILTRQQKKNRKKRLKAKLKKMEKKDQDEEEKIDRFNLRQKLTDRLRNQQRHHTHQNNTINNHSSSRMKLPTSNQLNSLLKSLNVRNNPDIERGVRSLIEDKDFIQKLQSVNREQNSTT